MLCVVRAMVFRMTSRHRALWPQGRSTRSDCMNACLDQLSPAWLVVNRYGHGDDNVNELAAVHLNAGELNRRAVRVQLSVHFVVAFANVNSGVCYTCIHDLREGFLDHFQHSGGHIVLGWAVVVVLQLSSRQRTEVNSWSVLQA